MKKKIVLSTLLMLASIASIGLVGCDSESAADSVTGSSSNSGFAITGKLAGTGFKNAQVCLDGVCVYPDATTGKYTLTGTTTKAAARVAAATAALDTAYIIVGNDTLKEIPITSWNSVIPEKYIVQRNVAVTVPTKYTKGDVQFVYWDNDSIAHAVGVPKTSGLKHSAYVYTYYDSTAFTNHDTVFSWFARIKVNDSVRTGTAINKLTYDAGDVVIDSSDFSTAAFVTEYYKTIPSGDTLSEYVSGTAASAYSNRKDSVLAYTLADTAAGSPMFDTIADTGSSRSYAFVLEFSDTSIDSACIVVTTTSAKNCGVGNLDTSIAIKTVGTSTITIKNRHIKAKKIWYTPTGVVDNAMFGNIGDVQYELDAATKSAITDLKVYYFKN